MHYPKDEDIKASFGLIKGINEKIVQHSCWTDGGSSGAPILTLDEHKVIGIHFGYKNKIKLNEGTFIKSVILELNKYKFKENNNAFVQLNVNYNLFNNNMNANNISNAFQKEKIIEEGNSQSIIPFPEENCDCFNILFEDSSNLITVIIIPPYKDISLLFDIYKKFRKDTTKNEIMFLYNGTLININKKMRISEVFQNNSYVTVI